MMFSRKYKQLIKCFIYLVIIGKSRDHGSGEVARPGCSNDTPGLMFNIMEPAE